MEQSNSPREIADRIVKSADDISYLAEALSKGALPDQWQFGPALELRVRFDRRFEEIKDSELLEWFSLIGIQGPLKKKSLETVGRNLAVGPENMLATGSWRPRGFGLWRFPKIPPMGVKVYPSRRPGVDLLIAVSQPFLRWTTEGMGFCSHWSSLADSKPDLHSFCEVAKAVHLVLRSSKLGPRLQATHLQDQAWCDSLMPSDRGFMVPQVISETCGWERIEGTQRGDWVGVAFAGIQATF
jgi:hypothetical protein